MEKDIAQASRLILPGERIDVIAFACTSGAMVIGDEAVAARIREARPGVACTTPLAAAVAGLKALGARRIALLTPYVDRLNRMMRDDIEARGLAVSVMGSFNHENDNEVACIDAGSVERAALELGAHESVDAVFVSCTSLRVVALVEPLERRPRQAGHLEQPRARLAQPAPRRLPRAGRRVRPPDAKLIDADAPSCEEQIASALASRRESELEFRLSFVSGLA